MQINVGFEMVFDCPQPTPMILNLVDPPVPMATYRDDFGNWCTRIVAPKGRTRVSADAVVNDTGLPDILVPEANRFRCQTCPSTR
jgi:hypothetical protein